MVPARISTGAPIPHTTGEGRPRTERRPSDHQASDPLAYIGYC
jgi:hypothetical protein